MSNDAKHPYRSPSNPIPQTPEPETFSYRSWLATALHAIHVRMYIDAKMRNPSPSISPNTIHESVRADILEDAIRRTRGR